MKIYILSFSCFLFVIANTLYAQQSNSGKIIAAKPRIINFSKLAGYKLDHPSKKKHKRFIEQGEDRDKDYKFKPKPVPSDALTFNVTLPPAATRSASPSPNIMFNGTLDDGSLIPPDINGVCGDTFILETNNQEFDIFDRTGLLNESLDLGTFFSGTNGSGFFDPHVTYDAINKKFIVCADGYVPNGDGGIFIAVSQTDNPTGQWNEYGIDGIGNGSDFLDYPLLGYNKNWIVVTGNDFLGSGPVITKIYVFNKDSMYNGSTVTVHTFTDQTIFSLCPASTYDTSQHTEYLVADWNGDSISAGYVRLYTITGTPNTPAYTPKQVIGVNQAWDENPVPAPQQGTVNTFEVGDTRISFAKYINGSLWFSHTVFLPAGNPTYDAVDWWEVNPATPLVQQFGRIQDTTGNVFYFYPSINVNANNNVLLGYSISSYTSYNSSGYAYRTSTDAPNTMEGGYIYQDGLATYYKTFGSGRNRWGDFSGTAVDPVNNSFWTFQEYANSPADSWGTVIANIGASPCNGKPTARVISTTTDTLCSGSIAVFLISGYTIGLSGIQLQWQQSLTGTGGWSDDSTSIPTIPSQFFSPQINQTTYFRCRVTCLNTGESSYTNIIPVYIKGLLTAPTDTFCTPGTQKITVKTVGKTKWYESDISNTILAIGDTLTATITHDSTFYVSIGAPVNYRTGISDSSVGTGTNYTNFQAGLEFTAINNFTLDSVFIYPSGAGEVIVNLVNPSTNAIMQSDTFSIPSSAAGIKTVLPLNMNIIGESNYNLNANGSTVSGLFRTNGTAVYPYVVPDIVSINHAINNASGYYYFFYDWRIASGCGTGRIAVPVIIDTVNLSITAKPDTLCDGESAVLSASGASIYNWMPGNITGNSITVKPTTTTTYTVTGTDINGCSGSSAFTMNVKNCTTGINQPSNAIGITLYPDPAYNQVNIVTEGVIPANSYLEIDNVLGQRLILTPILNGARANQPIDVSGFTSGIYFYKLLSGTNPLTEGKFVKD